MPPAMSMNPLAGASERKSSEQPNICREALVSNSHMCESLTLGLGKPHEHLIVVFVCHYIWYKRLTNLPLADYHHRQSIVDAMKPLHSTTSSSSSSHGPASAVHTFCFLLPPSFDLLRVRSIVGLILSLFFSFSNLFLCCWRCFQFVWTWPMQGSLCFWHHVHSRTEEVGGIRVRFHWAAVCHAA